MAQIVLTPSAFSYDVDNVREVKNPLNAIDSDEDSTAEIHPKSLESYHHLFGFDFHSYFTNLGLNENCIRLNSLSVTFRSSTSLSVQIWAMGLKTFVNGVEQNYYQVNGNVGEKVCDWNGDTHSDTVDLTGCMPTVHEIFTSNGCNNYIGSPQSCNYTGISAYFGVKDIVPSSKNYYARIRFNKITLDYSVINYTLTLNKSGDGTVSGGGSFAPNSSVTITATANSHSHFVRWGDGNTSATRQVTLSSDTILTAYFEKDKHTLTLNAGTGGSVSGGGTFDYGTSHTVTATANTGWHFVRWSDGNTNASRTVTVTQNTTLTAEFAKNSYTISTSSNAGGVVQGGGTFEFGSLVTLTAVSSSPNTFVRWSDGVTSEQRTVTVNGNASYKAIFGQFRPQITGCSLIYNGEQITENNKVPTNEGYIISVNVVDNLTEN